MITDESEPKELKFELGGQKRLSIGDWLNLEKWPHAYPPDIDTFQLQFVIEHDGREYRCGPAPHASATQASALIYHVKNMRGV